jgi:hypothetical protein
LIVSVSAILLDLVKCPLSHLEGIFHGLLDHLIVVRWKLLVDFLENIKRALLPFLPNGLWQDSSILKP